MHSLQTTRKFNSIQHATFAAMTAVMPPYLITPRACAAFQVLCIGQGLKLTFHAHMCALRQDGAIFGVAE
jgi:hypothetical protein